MNLQGRPLHYVFKIGDRTKNIFFFRDVLGMQVLRHEEFKEGCEAQCNGPYDGRWSKTMIGYGAEDSHFVLELTYNYNVPSYDIGNDFLGITIHSQVAIENAKKLNYPMKKNNLQYILESPDGYVFFIENCDSRGTDPVKKISLPSSNVENTISYWNGILGLKIINRTNEAVSFGFAQSQMLLEFKNTDEQIDHKTAFGRIAFSVPENQLIIVNESIQNSKHVILTPLVSLDTPGKATVTVIILADPDGYEICFVGDEGFRMLSVFDPEGNTLLERYLKKDEERQSHK